MWEELTVDIQNTLVMTCLKSLMRGKLGAVQDIVNSGYTINQARRAADLAANLFETTYILNRRLQKLNLTSKLYLYLEKAETKEEIETCLKIIDKIIKLQNLENVEEKSDKTWTVKYGD